MQEGPDRYYVTTYYPSTADAAAASPILVAPGETVRRIESALLPDRAVHRVSGFVRKTPSGHAAEVQLARLHGTEGSVGSDQMTQTRIRDGYFKLEGILPGTYFLVAQQIGPENQAPSASQMINIADEDIDNLTLVLAPRQTLPAQITSTDAAGCPVKDVGVMLAPKMAMPFGGPAQGAAGPDGGLKLSNVAFSQYELYLNHGPQGCYVASMHLGEEEVGSGELDFTQGVPAGNLVITLNAHAPSISGVVILVRYQDETRYGKTGACRDLVESTQNLSPRRRRWSRERAT